jgi:hypothetical protein
MAASNWFNHYKTAAYKHWWSPTRGAGSDCESPSLASFPRNLLFVGHATASIDANYSMRVGNAAGQTSGCQLNINDLCMFIKQKAAQAR